MIDISHVFDRSKTTFAINAAIELFGSMLIIIAIIMAFFMRIDKGIYRYVLLAGLFTVLAATGDAIAAIFRGTPGETARWVIIMGSLVI